MRILLILMISLGITMPLSAQRATMGKVLVKTLDKAEKLLSAEEQYADGLKRFL